jgi:hypothetical protein
VTAAPVALLAAGGAPVAGPIGAIVVGVMLVAGFFLLRSFNRHVKRVPRSFDDVPEADPRHQRRGKPPEAVPPAPAGSAPVAQPADPPVTPRADDADA